MADPSGRSVYSNYTLPSTAAQTQPKDPYVEATEAAYANYAKSPNYGPSKLGESAPTVKPLEPWQQNNPAYVGSAAQTQPQSDYAKNIEAAWASYAKSPNFGKTAADTDFEKSASPYLDTYLKNSPDVVKKAAAIAKPLEPWQKHNRAYSNHPDYVPINIKYEPYEIARARSQAALALGSYGQVNTGRTDAERSLIDADRMMRALPAIPEYDPKSGLSPESFYSSYFKPGPTAEELGLSPSDIPGLPNPDAIAKPWWPGITDDMANYYLDRWRTAAATNRAAALKDPLRYVSGHIDWRNPNSAETQIAFLKKYEKPVSTKPADQAQLQPQDKAWSVVFPTDPEKVAGATAGYRAQVVAKQILDRMSGNADLGFYSVSIANKLVDAGISDLSQFGPVPGGIGNKATGKLVSDTGLLGQVGRTSYGVSVGSNGQIQFVAQEQPERSGGILGDLAPIVGLGLAIFAPGIGTAIGTALGATGVAATVIGSAIVQGTLAEASGGDFADGAVKGAISAGVAPAVSSTIGSTVANAMADSAFKNIVTNAVTSSATSAITAGISGGDVGQAALTGALAGAGSAAGQELGISAKYGTDAFSDQTKALLAQEQGMGGASQLGGTLGVAAGKIAAGGDAEQILTSTLINTVTQGITDTLKTTVSDALKKPSAIVADSGEQDQGIEVPGSSDLLDIINGPSTQVAATDDDAALKAIEDLRTPQADTTVDDALLGLSSPEVGEGEQAAIDEALKQEPSAGTEAPATGDLATEQPATEETPFQGPMGPLTEDKIKRYNEEFAKYLDFLQAGEPPPPDYGVQDLGITGEYWDEFNQNLKQMTDEGRLPTQWQSDEEGNYTYVDDDGSTLTIGPDGNIVHYTEAPMGNLPGETPTTTPATTPTTTPVTTTPVTTTPVTTTPDTKTDSGMDLSGLLALLGGGQRKAPRAEDTTSEDPYVTFDWTKPLQTNPFASQGEAPKMAEGGSIDELLDMLQYRG